MSTAPKKNRELPASVYDNSEAKTKIMTAMTQEILSNYKAKIAGLEADNKQLIDELKAVTRNFEAISLKRLDDSNLIKRLEAEVAKLKTKPFHQSIDIKDNILKDYKAKNEELNAKVTSMESTYKTSMTKLTEEIFQLKKLVEDYKERISALKLRENSQSEKMLRDNEALTGKFQSLSDENKKLIGLIENGEKREGMLERKVCEMTKLNEKEVNEKTLLYKLLEEAREKLKEFVLKGSELVMQLKTKSKPEIELENNLAQAYKTIESLNETIEIMKNDIQFHELNVKSLTEDIKRLNKKPVLSIASPLISYSFKAILPPKPILSIMPSISSFHYLSMRRVGHQIDHFLFELISAPPQSKKATYTQLTTESLSLIPTTLQLPLQLKSLSASVKSSFASEALSLLMKPQTDAMEAMSARLDILNSKVFQLNSILFNNLLPILKELDKIANNSRYQKQKHLLEMKTMKELYETKLAKKRTAKTSLKTEIKTLNRAIKELNESKIDLTVINTLFNQASEIIDRLNLTFTSLEFTLKCKNCNKMSNRMFFNDCSHSCCVNCLKASCVECSRVLSVDKARENNSLNSIIGKFNYAKQQIESDLSLVLVTIKKYLAK